MPRKRPETRLNKISKMLIEEYQPETIQDFQEALKAILGDTMEQMLKAELDEHLDYEYGEKPLSLNTRNGSSKKTVKSSYGNIDLNIPRDREGSFEPQALKKYQKDISNIENQIIASIYLIHFLQPTFQGFLCILRYCILVLYILLFLLLCYFLLHDSVLHLKIQMDILFLMVYFAILQ